MRSLVTELDMVVSAFSQCYLSGIAHLSAITVLINASFLESNSYLKLPTVFDDGEGIEPPSGFSLFSQALYQSLGTTQTRHYSYI